MSNILLKIMQSAKPTLDEQEIDTPKQTDSKMDAHNDKAVKPPVKKQENMALSTNDSHETDFSKSESDSTDQNTKVQSEAATNEAKRDSWDSWGERYARALMSDRSCDHVGLDYFEGFPWDKKDSKAKAPEQSSQKHDDRPDKKEDQQRVEKESDKDTSEAHFDENNPPW